MDDTLRQLAQMFAFSQGKHLLGEFEPVTSSQDEGNYILKHDPANGQYQLLRVLRFTDTGNLKGATYEYPFGRRGYTGNDMASLLTLLCGSSIFPSMPAPVPVRRFQDEQPPYLLPQDDPWTPITNHEVWLSEASVEDVANPELPFRVVVELQFESCGLNEYYARERVISTLNDFFDRMGRYSNEPAYASDGTGEINANIRSMIRWEDHEQYPSNGG